MFHLHQSLEYYLYPFPVDMRKSFFTLSGIVNNEMNRDVRQGGVFIFINRRQTIIKILHMEYAGLVIYHKKLESGCVRLPSFDENTDELIITWHDLMTMIQEVKPRKRILQKKSKSFNNSFTFS
ncbi:MAG: IS66 family insertion sequence element accessory protein TnpB [Bacteroidetes bacterium]|jgi:transposase|nr:IS66 family insertion sequence element accessory protein TnpB [Bacteroidota bacterium]MBT4410177.1 IS66 family insertion sequence element accessory protein TnpB [Bacteroidota bacterium]MBT7092602.1 IS66 family insertion sequence element accessory protein TnpB [Bacteroidota bacterium]MBT7463987.1 IS66 family insertion sequence element accessory protein TnpB [Bacteroidota bacterium]